MSDKTPRSFASRAVGFFANARMLLVRFARSFWSVRTLIYFAGMLLILALFMAAIVPVRYDISLGMVPTHTITANRDIVDEVTTEQRRKAAADAVVPTYYYVDGITEYVLAQYSNLTAQMDAAVQYSETLDNYGPMRYYTEEERAYARTILTDLSLTDQQLRTLLNTSRDELTKLREMLYVSLQNMLTSTILEGHESDAITSMMQIVGYQVNNTSLLLNVVQPLLRAVVVPNMLIDQISTEAARQHARDSVEPVVYKQGQNIVVKGEGRIEKYQYELLKNLGLMSDSTVDINIYLGAMLLVIVVVSTALITLRIISPDVIKDTKKLLLIFSVAVITLGVCILMRLFNIYLAPVALCAILLAAMLDLRSAVVFNVTISVLISALAAGGSTTYTAEMVQLLACSMVSGSLSALLVYKRSNRLLVILSGVVVGISNFLVMIALGLMTSSTASAVIFNALWCMGGGLLSGLFAIAIQPMLEASFNFATPTKLMELSNPNHPLLRRLLLEAPGTYHHSIVVANLAEAAAESIGANPLLARVGGYYHDVGKLRRPQYFKENQLGLENKLNETDPYTAAQIIIAHPRDGVTLARKYHLPKEVCMMIQEHHGNTPVMYFYSKAAQEMGENNVDIASFRYDSMPPTTKEGAVLLLCDTIEAAVRSMHNPTPDAIEEFIVKLVRGKLQDGQLSLSPLTLRDIDAICKSCTTVLNGVFHERIEYPDPPAATKKKSTAKSAPIRVRVPDADEPWDGKAPQVDEPETETDFSYILPDAETIDTHEAPTSPFIVTPEQFAPLPVVDLPEYSEPASVEEVLNEEKNNQQASEDANA